MLFSYTEFPTRYRTRHFSNNVTTNEDIATKFEADTDTFLFISHTTNILLFKFRCNIFIGLRIIKEMPGSVASGTSFIFRYCTFRYVSVPVVARSKEKVCDRTPAEIVGSNLTRGHGCLSVVSVVCSQVEVSATG